MNLKYDDLESAYMFVSSEGGFSEVSAYVSRSTGKTYWVSDAAEEELPEDLEENDDYVHVPDQHDLDLGQNLVWDFVAREIPHLENEVSRAFSRKGAYGRYKSLLERTGFLEKWYAFENSREKQALLAWCKENGIPVELEQTAVNRSIDASLFAAGGADLRSFVLETVIAAPIEAVYAAWTDGRAFSAAYAPDQPEVIANIELAIGGVYEWLWDGETGSNGCQILSYIPNRMVSFSWNAPPAQPESRAKHTWVVVEFEAVAGGGTALTLTHLGFGTAPHWDETFEYFSKAWPHVFGQFRTHLETSESH